MIQWDVESIDFTIPESLLSSLGFSALSTTDLLYLTLQPLLSTHFVRFLDIFFAYLKNFQQNWGFNHQLWDIITLFLFLFSLYSLFTTTLDLFEL